MTTPCPDLAKLDFDDIDGIYLDCTCGWSKALGFDADLTDVVVAEVQHEMYVPPPNLRVVS